ncbi:MAG: Rrf2 family transcriptional regulator, partial [Bacillota bacterium]|nr:Rrf2 family transcriptional regulator [Bacillota bacterium]
REQGIITVTRGTGGTLLNRPPSEITLWEIYTAVEPEEAQSLIGRHPAPYEQCPVGKHIYELLAVPYQRVGTAVHQELEQYTLEMLLNHYKELNPQGYALPTERKTHD